MGGGVAMGAAAKVAGMENLNGGLRGGGNPVVSAVRQASRSVAPVVSSSDDVKLAIASNGRKTNSSVEKPCDDREFAGIEDELFMEAGEPMPRLVFGGAPTVREAKQATSDLTYALEKICLSPNATNGSKHVETKPCLVREASVTSLALKRANQAFWLLNENSAARNVVASIASDPKVWDAILQNKEFVDFLQTHKTIVVFRDMDPNGNDSFVQSPQPSESKSASGKGFMDYVDIIMQRVIVTVVDMMNSLSDTFQSLFGGLAKGEHAMNPDGTAGISVEKTTIGETLKGLAIMVIMVVALKRI